MLLILNDVVNERDENFGAINCVLKTKAIEEVSERRLTTRFTKHKAVQLFQVLVTLYRIHL